MVNSNVVRKFEPGKVEPDIFRAAANDDPWELQAALDEGQSLDSRNVEFYRMTPMHLACVHRSAAFLQVALANEFNPWARDSNGRLAMDHAAAQGLDDVADEMARRLYPPGPDGRPLMPF